MNFVQIEMARRVTSILQEHFEGYALVIDTGDKIGGLPETIVDGRADTTLEVIEMFEALLRHPLQNLQYQIYGNTLT